MNEILGHFNKLQSVHFFGDDNQQIYEGAFNQAAQLSMQQLVQYASQYGTMEVYDETLENNYRLPNPVACFVDAVEGPETMLGEKCFGRRTDVPCLLRFESDAVELETIRALVKLHKGQTNNYRAAVICYTCERCDSTYRMLKELHVAETSVILGQMRGALDDGNIDYQDERGPKTIDGEIIGSVNEIITTAFSSKGLQYDDVFILVDDFVREGGRGAAQWPRSLLNVLHVALTRTQGGLFVCYKGEAAYRPFADVPENYFVTEL